ncbi:MAG: ribosome biogenesis GTPase YlqF [Eubacteriales bacterium]|nr:ribosome biogenesis GTPase YlqF [Eubacteriales bacterium]
MKGENMPEINWYPGHMAKTRRLLEEQLRGVDAVIELCDARAPMATRNPELEKLCKNKSRFLALNKADLADDAVTKEWVARFKEEGTPAVRFQAVGGGGRKEMFALIERAAKPAVERMKARGAMKTARVMVVGIPNVGKSTFINRLRGSGIAKAGDRPGVTRASQWVKIGPYLELLDTPGMLWPKLADQNQAKILSFIGSVKDEILDTEGLACDLLVMLAQQAPQALMQRYKLPEGFEQLSGPELMEAACKGRGWLLSGGRYDTDRAAALILDEFRAGKVGRLTLERP